jgi:hypothetical protein
MFLTQRLEFRNKLLHQRLVFCERKFAGEALCRAPPTPRAYRIPCLQCLTQLTAEMSEKGHPRGMPHWITRKLASTQQPWDPILASANAKSSV